MTRPLTPIVVVKLGGSLLSWPEWPTRLRAFLATRPESRPVLIVGGGPFADVLRDLDKVHTLGEAQSHALALYLLDTTAHLAAALLPGSVVVTDPTALPARWAAGHLPIFAPRAFLDQDAAPDPLPHTWATTTDSIAARIATHLGADLVLLKSCPLPSEVRTWEEAATLGLVDPEFPRQVETMAATRFVDLRYMATFNDD